MKKIVFILLLLSSLTIASAQVIVPPYNPEDSSSQWVIRFKADTLHIPVRNCLCRDSQDSSAEIFVYSVDSSVYYTYLGNFIKIAGSTATPINIDSIWNAINSCVLIANLPTILNPYIEFGQLDSAVASYGYLTGPVLNSQLQHSSIGFPNSRGVSWNSGNNGVLGNNITMTIDSLTWTSTYQFYDSIIKLKLLIGNSSDTSLAGDVTGNLHSNIAGGLEGVSLPSLTAGNLKYNGVSWIFDTVTYFHYYSWVSDSTNIYDSLAIINSRIGSAGITALTGDGTASGSGSVAFTLAAVNSDLGTYGSASTSSSYTVNAKGLITASTSYSILISESQVTSLTTDLSARELLSNKTATASSSTTTYPNWSGLEIYGAATYQPLENQRLSTTNNVGFNTINLTQLAGTPGTPGSGLLIYADSLNRFSWKNQDGHVRTLHFEYAGTQLITFENKASYTAADSADVAALAISDSAIARKSISLTTLLNYGAATYNSTTGVFNIPIIDTTYLATKTYAQSLIVSSYWSQLGNSLTTNDSTKFLGSTNRSIVYFKENSITAARIDTLRNFILGNTGFNPTVIGDTSDLIMYGKTIMFSNNTTEITNSTGTGGNFVFGNPGATTFSFSLTGGHTNSFVSYATGAAAYSFPSTSGTFITQINNQLFPVTGDALLNFTKGDVVSSSSDGSDTLLLSLNATQTQINAIASPLLGQLKFNTTLGYFVFYNGAVWQSTQGIHASYSGTGTATTTFTVTIGQTMLNTSYQAIVQPTDALALGGYVQNKTTTTFDYVVPAATGSVTFDWNIPQ